MKTLENKLKNIFTGKPNVVVRPGEHGAWDIYELRRGVCKYLKSVEKLTEIRNEKVKVIAIPARESVNFLTEVNSTKKSIIKEVIRSQCKVKGLLLPKLTRRAFEYRVISQTKNKSLVIVTVIPHTLPKEVSALDSESYDISPNLMPLGKDTISIWRELGRLVVGITRGNELAYYQGLSKYNITKEMATELRCIQLQVSELIKSDEVPEVHLYGDFNKEEVDLLKHTFHLDIVHKPWSAPIPSKIKSRLFPLQAQLRLRQRNVKVLKKLVLATIIGAYVLAIGSFAWSVHALIGENSQNEAYVAKNKAEVDKLKTTERQWKSIQFVVSPDYSPLEILHITANARPEGINFTFFDVDNGEVVIEGTSQLIDYVFDFKDHLDDDNILPLLKWSLQQPTISSTGQSQFRLIGSQR